MKTLAKLIPFILIGSILLGGCKKDADPVNEEELITTLTMTWTPVGGGAPVIFQFKDLDGEGGNAPVITSGPLAANTTYGVSIVVLNESVTPAVDISDEIVEEGPEHQFFFATTAGVNLSFSYQDADTNGAPIGLSANMLTGDASSGKFLVTLRHDLNKGGAGVAQGDITNAGGDTDIEVEFDMVIQ
jgi:hypothetical protein